MGTVDVSFHRCFFSLETRPREAGADHVQGRGQGERAGPAGAGMAAAAGTLEPGRLSLYFCGSIRGGREDRELYVRIVSRLRRFGVVLTEHVAAAEVDESGEGGGARGAGGREGAGRPLCQRRTAGGLRPRAPTWDPTPRIQLLS